MHYMRNKRYGDPLAEPLPRTRSLVKRFWSKVNKTETCWLWTAGLNDAGYGAFSIEKRMVRAHRVAYELVTGPIPDGLLLDHLCRNRVCVNPAHLEAVTHAENVRRGDAGQHYATRTYCVNGHEFIPNNTIVRKGGGRDCRECNKRRMREYRARLRAAQSAV